MANDITILVQEVLQDSQGASRLATAIENLSGFFTSPPVASKVLFSMNFGRERSISYVMAICSNGAATYQPGAMTIGTAAVGATFEIEAAGVASLVSFMNTQINAGKTKIQVFEVQSVTSGATYVSVVMGS